MSSFSCPHIDLNSCCQLLKDECIPGRKGCVLGSKVSFAFAAEKRKLQIEHEKQKDPFKDYRRKKK
ncbi:MAG: hypothetical protein AB1394_01495 [Bacteroidota bacterium]